MREQRHWSTRLVPAREAMSYWKDVVCKNLLELDIASAHESSFDGSIAQYDFGPLTANFIRVSEQQVRRTRSLHRQSREGTFHLVHVRKGVQLVEQYGRRLTVEAGSCLLVDCFSTFDFQFPQGVEALVLEIQREWIRGWLPAPEDAVARVIDATQGWGATLASALANLTPESLGALALPQAVVAEQIATLLALSVGTGQPALSTHKRSLMRRMADTLRERCHDPDLDPGAVAAELGLSRRYVHQLFAAAGTTFTRELYDVRMERARRLLADKRFENVRIAEIAWNCGFCEPGHFARRFRRCFGLTPSAFRAAAGVEAAITCA